MRKTVSLSCELGQLAHVLAGARLLCEGVDQQAFDEAETRQVCRTLASTMGFMIQRVRAVCGAIRGEVDPAKLWDEHNAGQLGGDDRDLVLPVWRPSGPRPRPRRRAPARSR